MDNLIELIKIGKLGEAKELVFAALDEKAKTLVTDYRAAAMRSVFESESESEDENEDEDYEYIES